MAKKNKLIGCYGEAVALKFLQNKGFKLLKKNFTTRWGEIDLICKKNKEIHFIEVKSRIGDKKGKPYESINNSKINSLKRAIYFYILKNKLKNFKLYFDVISIIFNSKKEVLDLRFFENCSNFNLDF